MSGPTPNPARPDWSRRLRVLRGALDTHQLDALVVSSLVNIRYLTGFEGSAGVLVVTPDEAVLLVDGRYEAVARAARSAGALARVEIERIPGRSDPGLIGALERLAAARIGVEAEHVSVATNHRWQDALGPAAILMPTFRLVESQRLIKDEVEIATLRLAARKLSEVASALAALVQIGRSERQIAAGIDAALLAAGFAKPAFETIVASGPNGAYPHARPTDRRIARGDLLVLDFGGVLDGYSVDLTRAASVGPPGAEAESLVRAVRQAQDAAIAAIRPGVKTADVDRAARDVLSAQGLGSRFVHGTGHGLGLEVHEGPHLGAGEPGSGDSLEVGMVVTVEPGVYVEGLGGVRLEDDVLVTREGCELLTIAPRHLLVV